jgi:sec-independent protein translocase protein TatA
MGNFSLMHWIVVAIVALVLFGRGRISETMGDFGKGIKSFRRGLAEDDKSELPAPSVQPTAAVDRPMLSATATEHGAERH